MALIYLWGEAERFQNYTRAITAAGGCVRFGGTSAGCDGLLLAGGGDMEPWRYGQENTASRGLEPQRDAEELELLERFVSQGKPVLGICRGLQVINVAFGGTLAQDVAGHGQASGCDRFHRICGIPSPLGKVEIVNSAHHQAIDRLGSGLTAVQWSPDGIIEAVCHRTCPVWGVQWHPERMPPWMAADLMGRFLNLCES